MFSSIDLRGEQGKDIGCLITKITKSISAKCTVNASILFIAFTLLPLTFFRRTQNICWKLPDPRSINWILVWIFLPFWTQRKRIREGERGGREGESLGLCVQYTQRLTILFNLERFSKGKKIFSHSNTTQRCRCVIRISSFHSASFTFQEREKTTKNNIVIKEQGCSTEK